MESLFLTGPSTEILFDASKLYDAYRRKNSEPLEGNCCRVERIRFESSSYPLLLEEDRIWEENIRFEFPLFIPTGTCEPKTDLLVILNGLNETTYVKLFPWALNIARMTGNPTVIFPLAPEGVWFREILGGGDAPIVERDFDRYHEPRNPRISVQDLRKPG